MEKNALSGTRQCDCVGNSSDDLADNQSSNPNNLSKGTLARSTMRPAHSTSCLSAPSKASVSPVLMFLPKILRSSLSRMLSIPQISKSSGSDKDGSESDFSSLSLSDSHRNHSSSSLVSSVTEEMVSESMEKGLPIIPFAHTTFPLTNMVNEEVKPTRRNSLKSLKLSFCENKMKNKHIYKEDEEEPESEEKAKHDPYVEMSPGHVNSMSTKNRFGEEPYMCMNDIVARDTQGKGGYSRKFSEEQIFSFEQGSPPQKEFPNVKNIVPEYVSSTRKGTYFSMGDGTMSMERGLSRLHRKGNKHKGDYVFLDFERQNYVDMQQLGSKKWKFLTLYSSSRKREKLG